MEERKKKEHPGYGMLQISHFSGGNSTYFGSSIKHSGGVVLRICAADVERGLNSDWYHAGKTHIEIEMSNTQFAEAITSGLNTSGTPCTIKRIDGKKMPPVDFVDKRLQFEQEMEERMARLSNKLDVLLEDSEEVLSGSKAPNKGDRMKIVDRLKMIKQEIKSNIPFVGRCFNEQMDKTVMEAKGEIEGFYTRKIHELGIEKLGELAGETLKVPTIEHKEES